MVFSKSKKLMDFNLLESEILGVKESGLVSSPMRMKLGTTTKVLRRSSIMYLRAMVIGG